MSIVDEYENLDLIGNARADSVLYDLPPAPTGKKGRPAKHGRRLSIDSDFALSGEKAGDYYTGCRRVLTNIFGAREAMAYLTCTGKENGTRRLFFSTICHVQLQIFCAWQEKAPLNQTGSGWMPYIPLFLYSLCRNSSVQEFRFALSEQIRRQIFYVNLVQHVETHIKSMAVIKALRRLCLRETA